ncbi:MAG: rod-binding protein [Rhodopirellula sp.]|nr:rod-binding protein [Rhodopirellula sp.]
MTDSIQHFGTPSGNSPGLRETFDQSVGATFFRQMLKSLRSSTSKPAYFHGGQAEEIFQSQLDEILISDMASASGHSLSADLFQQQFPNYTEPTQNASAQPDSSPVTPEKQSSIEAQLKLLHAPLAKNTINFDA